MITSGCYRFCRRPGRDSAVGGPKPRTLGHGTGERFCLADGSLPRWTPIKLAIIVLYYCACCKYEAAVRPFESS